MVVAKIPSITCTYVYKKDINRNIQHTTFNKCCRNKSQGPAKRKTIPKQSQKLKLLPQAAKIIFYNSKKHHNNGYWDCLVATKFKQQLKTNINCASILKHWVKKLHNRLIKITCRRLGAENIIDRFYIYGI